MVPQNVHVLISRTYEYATLLGKRDFADMIEVGILIILDYLIGPNVITKVVIRERGRPEYEGSESEGDLKMLLCWL